MDQRISFLTLAVRDLVAPFTISHNVATLEEVDAVLATARAAGADPDGYRWEIATNPGPIGQKVLP